MLNLRRTGLTAIGEHVGNPKLTEKEVMEIRELKCVIAQVLVAEQYVVHISTVSGVCLGKI